MHPALIPQSQVTLCTHANIQKVCRYASVLSWFNWLFYSTTINKLSPRAIILSGKSIGKHVFLSRVAVNASTSDQEGNNAIKAKLLQLEANFYKSSSLESDASLPFLTSYPGGGILVPNQVRSFLLLLFKSCLKSNAIFPDIPALHRSFLS